MPEEAENANPQPNLIYAPVLSRASLAMLARASTSAGVSLPLSAPSAALTPAPGRFPCAGPTNTSFSSCPSRTQTSHVSSLPLVPSSLHATIHLVQYSANSISPVIFSIIISTPLRLCDLYQTILHRLAKVPTRKGHLRESSSPGRPVLRCANSTVSFVGLDHDTYVVSERGVAVPSEESLLG